MTSLKLVCLTLALTATPGSSLSAAPLLNDVGYTTVGGTDAYSGLELFSGENIYGPFEAGFDGSIANQAAVLEGLGCSAADAASAYVPGGVDTKTAESMVAAHCGITLPREEEGNFIGMVDSCGGHTQEYHFHQRLACLYDMTAAGHSTQVGESLDGSQYLYGKYEDTDVLPELDACGAHYGVTPDSAGASVYHYHVQEDEPFTFGCYGPNEDDSVVTQEQCEALYDGCSGTTTTLTTTEGDIDYRLWCPCYGNFTANPGTCFHDTSTVRRHLSEGASEIVPLAELRAGDAVLAMDHKTNKFFANVKQVNRSPSVEAFVDIAMRSAVGDNVAAKHHITATEHHTFPTCSKSSDMPSVMKSARSLKAGDCLHTADGRRLVESATPRAVVAGDHTVTVVLEGGTELLVVGGVVTHAKAEHVANKKSRSAQKLTKGALRGAF